MLRLWSTGRLVRAAAFLFFFLFAATARADDAPIALVVHGDELPREKLRDAIASELGRPVVLADRSTAGVVTVTWRRSAKELAVTWDGPKHGTVSRVIAARTRIEDVTADAALLASNLARDEVEDILGPPPPAAPLEPLPPPASEPPPEPASPPPARETPKPARDPDFVDGNFGLLYPLSLDATRPWVRTRFDLNILHGRVGQIDGVQLGGVNVIARSQGKGTGDMTGLQLGYALNVATGRVQGVQLGAIANVAGGAMSGAQTAFLFNRAGDVEGGQLAIVNVGGDVKGMQLGLVNVARKVDGVMLGVINVADDVDGVPVGLASVTKTGGVHPTAWSSNASFANVGIKLATKHTFTMPSGHWHHLYGKDFYGAGFTIGGRIPLDDARYVETDLGFAWLYAPERTVLPNDPDTYHEHLLQPRLRVSLGWRFAEHFGIFAGAGVLTQVRLERDGNKVTGRVGPEGFLGVEL